MRELYSSLAIASLVSTYMSFAFLVLFPGNSKLFVVTTILCIVAIIVFAILAMRSPIEAMEATT